MPPAFRRQVTSNVSHLGYPMSAIALLTEPGSLVGFLLLANPAAISQAPAQTDCVLTGTPTTPVLLSHPLSTFIQANKNVEFVCTISRIGDAINIHGKLIGGEKIQLEIKSQGSGSWSIIQKAGT